jgi:hypothetical protein
VPLCANCWLFLSSRSASRAAAASSRRPRPTDFPTPRRAVVPALPTLTAGPCSARRVRLRASTARIRRAAAGAVRVALQSCARVASGNPRSTLPFALTQARRRAPRAILRASTRAADRIRTAWPSRPEASVRTSRRVCARLTRSMSATRSDTKRSFRLLSRNQPQRPVRTAPARSSEIRGALPIAAFCAAARATMRTVPTPGRTHLTTRSTGK